MLFAGQDIDRSPFKVNVSKAMGDPSRVQARGPGLQQAGNVACKPTYFDIYTAGKEGGDPPPSVPFQVGSAALDRL